MGLHLGGANSIAGENMTLYPTMGLPLRPNPNPELHPKAHPQLWLRAGLHTAISNSWTVTQLLTSDCNPNPSPGFGIDDA